MPEAVARASIAAGFVLARDLSLVEGGRCDKCLNDRRTVFRGRIVECHVDNGIVPTRVASTHRPVHDTRPTAPDHISVSSQQDDDEQGGRDSTPVALSTVIGNPETDLEGMPQAVGHCTGAECMQSKLEQDLELALEAEMRTGERLGRARETLRGQDLALAAIRDEMEHILGGLLDANARLIVERDSLQQQLQSERTRARKLCADRDAALDDAARWHRKFTQVADGLRQAAAQSRQLEQHIVDERQSRCAEIAALQSRIGHLERHWPRYRLQHRIE